MGNKQTGISLEKVAQLLESAADLLEQEFSSEKQASELAQKLASRGYIAPTDEGRYALNMMEDQELLNKMATTLETLPELYKDQLGKPVREISKTAGEKLTAEELGNEFDRSCIL